MNKPNITLQEATAIIRSAATLIERSVAVHVGAGRLSAADAATYVKSVTKIPQGGVVVGAIRGYYLNTQGKPGENDRGVYDDAMFVIAPNFFETYNANTDPRVKEKGKAMLLPGWHLFKQGWHGYGKPSGHKAFRTANYDQILPVLRDGEVGVKKGFTINLHSGGYNNTNSAGCQTIFKGQWQAFQKKVYELMDKEGQKELPYLLIEEVARRSK